MNKMDETGDVVLLVQTSICLPDLYQSGIDLKWEIPISRIKSTPVNELVAEMLGGNGNLVASEKLALYLLRCKDLLSDE